MKLLIIRHGDPDYVHDTLTEKGKREAELLSRMLVKEKIDFIYCSPLGRAKETCAYTAEKLKMTPVVCPWLQEFDYRVELPDGEKNHLIWDMLPEFWTGRKEMYDNDCWLDQPFMETGHIREHYRDVIQGFDELLAKHGYMREGKIYRAENPN